MRCTVPVASSYDRRRRCADEPKTVLDELARSHDTDRSPRRAPAMLRAAMNSPSAARVGVVGAGYVGLTTAAALAHLGHRVVCADILPERIARLERGEIPIVEAGLAELVAEGQAAGRLSFVVGAERAAADADFVFLCVETPQGPDGGADLRSLEAASAQIAPVLRPGALVVNKSTVPVGSARAVERRAATATTWPWCRTRSSCVRAPRCTTACTPTGWSSAPTGAPTANVSAALYAGLDAPVIITDPASAETIKYAANGFLAMKLSFINAIAAMCESVGAHVDDVIEGIGSDRRIGPAFLRPGPGWGGSCFPKDSRALVKIASDHGYDFTLMKGRHRRQRGAAPADGRQGARRRPDARRARGCAG